MCDNSNFTSDFVAVLPVVDIVSVWFHAATSNFDHDAKPFWSVSRHLVPENWMNMVGAMTRQTRSEFQNLHSGSACGRKHCVHSCACGFLLLEISANVGFK